MNVRECVSEHLRRGENDTTMRTTEAKRTMTLPRTDSVQVGVVRGLLALVLVIGAVFVALGLAAPRGVSMTGGGLALGALALLATFVAVPWLLGFSSPRWRRWALLLGVVAVALLATAWWVAPASLL